MDRELPQSPHCPPVENQHSTTLSIKYVKYQAHETNHLERQLFKVYYIVIGTAVCEKIKIILKSLIITSVIRTTSTKSVVIYLNTYIRSFAISKQSIQQ